MGFSLLDNWVKIYGIVLMLVLGAVFGSFLKCMAVRRSSGESVIHGRSRCESCGHVLGAWDLVPVFSYIFLKGRCRYCGAKVPTGDLAAEVIMGLAFMVLWLRFGLQWELLRYAVLSCILMLLSLTDLEDMEIPNGCIVTGIVWWAATVPLMDTPWKTQILQGVLGAFVISGAMLLLSLLFDRVTGKESLGGGDIKLFFMTGLFTGLAGGVMNLIASCIIGLAFGAAMKAKERPFPFGPAIALSTYIVICFGEPVIKWYMGLLA